MFNQKRGMTPAEEVNGSGSGYLMAIVVAGLFPQRIQKKLVRISGRFSLYSYDRLGWDFRTLDPIGRCLEEIWVTNNMKKNIFTGGKFHGLNTSLKLTTFLSPQKPLTAKTRFARGAFVSQGPRNVTPSFKVIMKGFPPIPGVFPPFFPMILVFLEIGQTWKDWIRS